MVKEAKRVHFQLPPDIITLLRPLQKQMSSTMRIMSASPWAFMCNLNGTSYAAAGPSTQTQLPMTPQSAALGPAVQATVPSTPQSASSFSSMFNGNVFDRADALLSMNSGTVPSSRTGTMTNANHSFGSDGSVDGHMANSSGNFNRTSNRYNSNGKISY